MFVKATPSDRVATDIQDSVSQGAVLRHLQADRIEPTRVRTACTLPLASPSQGHGPYLGPAATIRVQRLLIAVSAQAVFDSVRKRPDGKHTKGCSTPAIAVLHLQILPAGVGVW